MFPGGVSDALIEQMATQPKIAPYLDSITPQQFFAQIQFGMSSGASQYGILSASRQDVFAKSCALPLMYSSNIADAAVVGIFKTQGDSN